MRADADAASGATAPRAAARPSSRRAALPRQPARRHGLAAQPARQHGDAVALARPGMRWSRVTLADDRAANVFLLRIAAGKSLPAHTHDGIELTQVLHGAFHDGRERFDAGDFDEADGSIHHQPVVEPGGECICLASVEGRVAFDGRIAADVRLARRHVAQSVSHAVTRQPAAAATAVTTVPQARSASVTRHGQSRRVAWLVRS
jgi:putative transcriptional regulator